MADRAALDTRWSNASNKSRSTATRSNTQSDDHVCIPLPIQSFLWRQTNPFLGPKVGKLHEASCVTFERVVVQNILHGLSPSLSDAIASIPRWRFIKAAFAHVVQCCSALLTEQMAANADLRDGSQRKLGNSLVKILYILHWMVLDSASECQDADSSQMSSDEAMLGQLVFPINCVQTFVYLLAPLVDGVNERDLAAHFRLESGLPIWRALWQRRQPPLLCLRAPVKPRHSQLAVLPFMRKSLDVSAAHSIYVGDEASTDITLPVRSPSASAAQRPAPQPQPVPPAARQLTVSVERPPAVSVAPKSASVVRSVSEYKKRPEAVLNKSVEHKLVGKSATTGEAIFTTLQHNSVAYSIPTVPECSLAEGAFQLREIEHQLKYVEESSLSEVIDTSDKAPLVQLQEICSESSDSADFPAAAQYEVLCEVCNTVLTSDGSIVGACKCAAECAAVATPQLRLAPADVRFASLETIRDVTPSTASHRTTTLGSAEGSTSATTVQTPTPLEPCAGGSHARMRSATTSGSYSDRCPPSTSASTADSRNRASIKNALALPGIGAASTAALVSWADSSHNTQPLSAATTPTIELFGSEPEQASYFDVAVLRSLFIKHWSESGVMWALEYFYNRLVDLRDWRRTDRSPRHRKRSSSMPALADDALLAFAAKQSERALKQSRCDLQLATHTEAVQSPTWRDLQLAPALDEPSAPTGRPKVAFSVDRRESKPPREECAATLAPTLGADVSSVQRRRSFAALKLLLGGTIGAKDDDAAGLSPPSAASVKSSGQNAAKASSIGARFGQECATEAVGSTSFINKDGSLKLSLIVKAINGVLERHSSLRICEFALNNIDIILGIDDSMRGAASDAADDFANSTFAVTVDTLIRHFLVLGCPNGCNDSVRSNQADFLRGQARNALASLQRMDSARFGAALQRSVDTLTPQRLIDFVHAFSGFCRTDRHSRLRATSSPVRAGRASLPHADERAAGTYRNNFLERHKGVEGALFNCVLKPLVSKLMRWQQLSQPEYMGFYYDVRSLVAYAQEQHGNPFRRVQLSALLDATVLPAKSSERSVADSNAASAKARPYSLGLPAITVSDAQVTASASPSLVSTDSDSSRKASPANLQKPAQPKEHLSLRRGLFKRYRDKADDGDECSAPATQRHAAIERLSSAEEAAMASSSSPLLPAATSPHHAYGNSTKKRTAKLQFPFNILKSVRSDSQLGADDSGDASDTENTDRSMEDLRAAGDSWLTVKAGCDAQPEKAPLVARASILLECAFFVHRCNRGHWPDWIRQNVPAVRAVGSSSGALGNRGTPSGVRRTHSIQRAAGHMFYQWARQLGQHLEQLLAAQKLTPESLVTMTQSEQKRRQLRIEDDLEDFLDDGAKSEANGDGRRGGIAASVNAAGTACPPALMLLACILLGEITAFLRETFQMIPRSRNNSRPGLHPGWDKLMSHRRWSILSSTFNPAQQHSGSIQSISDLAAILHPSMGERRISFTTPEDDSPPADSQAAIASIAEDSFSAPDKRKAYKHMKQTCSLTLHYPARQRSVDWDAGQARSATVSTARQPSQSAVSVVASTLTTVGTSLLGAESARRLAQGRQRLLNRASLKRRPSIKLKKSPNDDTSNETASALPADMKRGEGWLPQKRGFSLKRLFRGTVPITRGERDTHGRLVSKVTRKESTRSMRKVSTATAAAADDAAPVDVEPSAVHATLPVPAAAAADGADDDYMFKSMPWLKVVVRLANTFNFICDHERCCHANCFERVRRQSHRMTVALRKVYGEEMPLEGQLDRRKMLLNSWQEYQESKRSASARQSTMRRESANVRQDMTTLSTMKALLIEKMNEADECSKEANGKPRRRVSDDAEDDTAARSQPEQLQLPMHKYLMTQIRNPIHSPLTSALKGAVILSDAEFQDIIPVAWEMLLSSDSHVTTSAASLFIAASVKRPSQTVEIMQREISEANPTRRLGAIVRFLTLWRNRYHCWLKMEEGAHVLFKVPPPGIDFTLPSPAIGLSQVSVVDPPWMPHLKTKVQELTLKEEEDTTSQTIMAMTKTRRKQKQEMVKRAIQDAEEKLSERRQEFTLLATAAPQQAAFEPSLFHQQPTAATSGAQPSAAADDDNEADAAPHPTARHQLPVAQPLFPSCLLSVVPRLVNMLDDCEVAADGTSGASSSGAPTPTPHASVAEMARKVVWTCLVEDAALFLRHFLEKLTSRERQYPNRYEPSVEKDELLGLLRKLLIRFKQLPAQTAAILLNYLIGFVMYYVRSPCEGSQTAIATSLGLIWMVAPSVQGLYFKDMKQTLRKEQCDHALLITANVPSAKKILVYGPDATGIPSQFPVHEETQFQQLLTDSLEFFNIPDDQIDEYFLVDGKSGLLHTPSAYVRDFYFFHRSFYPQLNLVRMEPAEAAIQMKHVAFTQKLIDVGKVLMTLSILKASPEAVVRARSAAVGQAATQVTQRIYFLHEELTRLAAFPRKALEAQFGMYGGVMGAQLLAVDTLHKFNWARLMAAMFDCMENPYVFGDLHLFVNVVNGALLLHCEDAQVLRRCLATYLNMAVHFNTLFAVNGFFLIMPTILRCYSQRQTNHMFSRAIEFLCKQFYILHRKPFLLQMFGSVANILDCDPSGFHFNAMKVKARYLFRLLEAMEQLELQNDQLEVLRLVDGDKPLKALDLCYKDDPTAFCFLTDALASCVTICAVGPELRRCYQMMTVIDALVPHYVKSIEETSRKSGNTRAALKHEAHCYATLVVEVKSLINSCDVLARTFSGPQRNFDLVNVSGRGKSMVADSPQFFEMSATLGDDARNLFVRSDSKRATAAAWEAFDDNEMQREAFRRTRDALLSLSASFLHLVAPRLRELSKLLGENAKVPDALDHKSYVKLSEIALALLKLVPYDPATMSSEGLQKYFLHVLPATDWSVEHNRSSLNVVLKRLDKTFAKIGKKGAIRRRANWAAMSNWLKGLYDTLVAFPYIAHLHPLKTTTQMCLKIIVSDPSLYGDDQSSSSVGHHTVTATVLHGATPPQHFCAAVLKLTAFLMQALGEQTFSLEYICGADTLGAGVDRIETVLCHILMPLFLRAGTAKKDAPQLRQRDICFCLSYMLSAINPAVSKQSLAPLPSMALTLMREPVARQGSVSVTERGHSATISTPRFIRESVCQSVFLALKIMIVSFHKQLTNHWPKIGKIVRDLATKRSGGMALWNFVEFLVTVNTPITLLIAPLIQQKVEAKLSHGLTDSLQLIWQKTATEQDAHWFQELRDRLGSYAATPKCHNSLLTDLSHELEALKDDFYNRPIDAVRSHTPTIVDTHSDSGSTQSVAAAPARGSHSRRLSFNTLARLAKFAPTRPAAEHADTIAEATVAEEADADRPAADAPPRSPSAPRGFGASPAAPRPSAVRAGGFKRHRSTIHWGQGSRRWRTRTAGSKTQRESEATVASDSSTMESLEMQPLPRRSKSLIRRFGAELNEWRESVV